MPLHVSDNPKESSTTASTKPEDKTRPESASEAASNSFLAAKKLSTEMLHKPLSSPPPLTTPPAKLKAKVLFGVPGDLRNHVMAVQEQLTPPSEQQEPTPPSSPKRKLAVPERLKSPSEQEVPSPSSPKRKKKKKKKRSSSYEESASPPQPPPPVAATAAPPEPAVPDAATSTPPVRSHKKRRYSEDTHKKRNSPQEKSPPVAAARESPAEAVAAVPDEMLSNTPVTTAAPATPIPSRRSRRAKGPKKCHNCKTFQPNYLKCQFFMATGCKCGKHYCIGCMSTDYSDDFDMDNTDEWQ
jgi:hypothetical protein